jgi:hypothetical protein
MRLRSTAAAAFVALAGAGVAFGNGTFKGQPAPELGRMDWVQGEPVENLRAMRGKVVLLEFFGTT